ncbi:MAG: signal peptidase I [Acidimicrobiia bacterium]
MGSIAWRVLMLVGLLGIVVAMMYLRTFPPTATVMSGSMEPKIAVGDIVVFKATGGATPSVGDIVEVEVPREYREKFQYPSVVIHRVIAVNDDGTLETKGDNLQSPDPFDVQISSVDRKVVATIPMAGRMLGFLFSPFGLLWLAIGLLIFVVLPFYDVQKERAELHHIEVAAISDLHAKVDRATAWSSGQDGRIIPFAEPPPHQTDSTGSTGSTEIDLRAAHPFDWAPVVRDAVPATPLIAPDPEVRETLGELVSAVGEYGEHLRSHTAILQSMSAASQDLAKVVAQLQQTMAAGAVPQIAAPPAAATPVAASPVAAVPIPPSPLGARLLLFLRERVGHEWSVIDAGEVAAASRSDVTSVQVRAAMGELLARGEIELHPVQPPDLFRVRVV